MNWIARKLGWRCWRCWRRAIAHEELLYDAWTLIANAGEGDWDRETPEWRKAAERWRDDWHEWLASRTEPTRED